MSEATKPKNEYALSPAEILEGLANNMRTYDELVAQKSPLLERRESAFQKLQDLDPNEENWHVYPREMAFHALELVVAEKKIAIVEEGIRELKGHFMGVIFLRLGGLAGKKIEVTSVNPGEHEIGAFFRNDYHQLDYAGRKYSSHKGKISDLSLDPVQGGFIQFKGRTYTYQAGPLIDRKNDYQPAFSIELI